MNFGHIKKIHFVGIGGIGMSGIAEILASSGFEISGCDSKRSTITNRFAKRGMDVTIGHDPAHAEGSDLLVVSSAIRKNDPEVFRARELRIPVIRRAEMLGELSRLKRTIAIAGTHGKTTTSAMTAIVLSEAGLDPTLIIGGVLRNMDTSNRLGASDLLVVEADEYDRSFLDLYPTISVITNIESDHLDCYRDFDDIRATFEQYAKRVPFFGAVIGCADDPVVADMLDHLAKPTIGYGLSSRARLRAVALEFHESGTAYRVEKDGIVLGDVRMHVPGEHNVRNSLAAVAVGLEIGIAFSEIAAALSKFRGVERRFQILGEFNGALVVDDYAHHPTEIRATLDAARRSYPDRRIVALFQPHLYSRTNDFHEDFADALQAADLAFVAPIYAAREEPIEGVTSAMITDAARARGAESVALIEGEIEEMPDKLRNILRRGDLFITMGAGDVCRVSQNLAGVEE